MESYLEGDKFTVKVLRYQALSFIFFSLWLISIFINIKQSLGQYLFVLFY